MNFGFSLVRTPRSDRLEEGGTPEGIQMTSKINKVHPDENEHDSDNEDINEEEEDLDQENNNDKTNDNSINKSLGDNQNDYEFAEEPESRDKIIRKELDKYLTQHPAGKVIQIFIAITSVISSVTYVVMTHYDWSQNGECCKFQTDPNATDEQKDCYPKCN